MYKWKISQSGPTFFKIIYRIEWNRETVIYKVHFQPIFINSKRNKFQVKDLEISEQR